MLAAIVGNGANLFLIIFVILAGLGAGITTTDFLKTKEKAEQQEQD